MAVPHAEHGKSWEECLFSSTLPITTRLVPLACIQTASRASKCLRKQYSFRGGGEGRE